MSGMNFRCVSTSEYEIPVEIMKRRKESFPNVHTKSEEIANLSKELKNYNNDSICTVPFCSTVEVEALGGIVNLGDERIGPRINEFVYKNIEELKTMKPINFNSGRIKEVLNSIAILSKEGEVVALNISGPFMILTSLIDPMIFYKSVRKDKESVKEILELIEDSLVEYIKEAIKKDVKIISFSDSVGTEEIVGPHVYKELAGVTVFNILEKIKQLEEFREVIVHLCGKTSVSLEKYGFMKSKPLLIKDDITYGEAIINLINREDIQIIGHSCMKRTPNKLNKREIWYIE